MHSSIFLLQNRTNIWYHRIGWKHALPFQQYNAEWRQHRKEFHRTLHINAVQTYRPGETAGYRRMISDILDTPEDFLHHVHAYVLSFFLQLISPWSLNYSQEPRRRICYALDMDLIIVRLSHMSP